MDFVKVFILFSLLWFSFFLNAQNTEVDSLLQVLKSVPEQEKAHIFNRLAKIDSKNNHQKKIDYGTKALDIAREFELKDEEVAALENIATGYAFLGDNNKALEYDLKALDIAEKEGDDKSLANVYIALGYDYYFLGDYNKALKFNLKSLKVKNRLLETGVLKSDRIIATSYNNIGSLYNALGQSEKAIEYQKKALEIRKKYSDSTGIGRSLHNIGAVYEKLNKNEKAKEYYLKALSIREVLGNKQHIAETLNNLGNVYKDLNENDKSLKCYIQALEVFDDIKDEGRVAVTNNNIAGLYIKEKKPDKAYPFIMKGIKMAEKSGQKKTLNEVYENLSGYYVLKNDYKNAYSVQKKMFALKDSIFSNDLVEKVSEMQVKYETERKEKEIEILARDKEIQSLKIRKQSVQLYFLIAFIVLAAVISLLVFSRFRLKQKHVRIELEKKNLETEQRLLRSQMNPHFIFNSMNSIQSYISGNDSFTAMTYLSKFARLMRNILENSRKSLILLSDEISTLELYIELERIRFKQKFDYQIKTEPELPVDTIYIPPMLIQPFVENSIKHGLRHKSGKGILEVEFEKSHQYIKCTVKDNGIGREKSKTLDKDKNKNHRSLGMQVTRERLEILSKAKGLTAGFKITDLKNENGENEGTLVVINIPYEMD